MKKAKSKFYLTNKEFLRELKRYHRIEKVSRRLHEMFYILSERIAKKSLFYNKVMNQSIKSSDFGDAYYDFIHQGYIKCIERIKSFNIETHNNPFAYFTSIITNSFKDFFNKEYRYDILRMISQNEFEHKFLMRYGFKLDTTNYEED